jgi:hypothetical protein
MDWRIPWSIDLALKYDRPVYGAPVNGEKQFGGSFDSLLEHNPLPKLIE